VVIIWPKSCLRARRQFVNQDQEGRPDEPY
jgi:hypothetical protein